MATQFIEGLAVETAGEGSPVVCIHGLGGSSNSFAPVMKALVGHRVVRIDLPGSARSGSGSGKLSIELMVEAVRKVLQRLGIVNARLIGHSMGSIVCQHLAHRDPSLVKSMLLFGPLACPPEAARPNIVARARKVADGGMIAMAEIADAIVEGATAKSTREENPVATALIRESLMRQDPQGYARCCSALANAQSAPLEEISVPVWLVTGDEDAVAPAESVRIMGRRLPNARVDILRKCGHWTMMEKPDECTALLKDFVRH